MISRVQRYALFLRFVTSRREIFQILQIFNLVESLSRLGRMSELFCSRCSEISVCLSMSKIDLARGESNSFALGFLALQATKGRAAAWLVQELFRALRSSSVSSKNARGGGGRRCCCTRSAHLRRKSGWRRRLRLSEHKKSLLVLSSVSRLDRMSTSNS